MCVGGMENHGEVNILRDFANFRCKSAKEEREKEISEKIKGKGKAVPVLN
jgi:hypothetical protein